MSSPAPAHPVAAVVKAFGESISGIRFVETLGDLVRITHATHMAVQAQTMAGVPGVTLEVVQGAIDKYITSPILAVKACDCTDEALNESSTSVLPEGFDGSELWAMDEDGFTVESVYINGPRVCNINVTQQHVDIEKEFGDEAASVRSEALKVAGIRDANKKRGARAEGAGGPPKKRSKSDKGGDSDGSDSDGSDSDEDEDNKIVFLRFKLTLELGDKKW